MPAPESETRFAASPATSLAATLAPILVLVFASLLATLLASCSLFGGKDADPPQYSPPDTVDVMVQVRVGPYDNPRVDRLVLDIAVGDSLSPPNHVTSFDSLATVLWFNLLGESPAAVRVKGYAGERWVAGTTWSGYLPHSRDTTITLALHPVYDNLFSPLDTMPRLRDMQVTRLRFTLAGGSTAQGQPSAPTSPTASARPAMGLSWAEAALVDSAAEAQNPGRANAVLYGDTLYATNRLRLTDVTSYPTAGGGYCHFMRLPFGERAGYQTLTSMTALRMQWRQDSSQQALAITSGQWIMITEEDNAYLLHTVAADRDPGNGQVAYEWEVYRFRPD
jgi:hypothetical protein